MQPDNTRQVIEVAATALAICALAPAVAAAKIVPGHGVAGLKLGDSTVKVMTVLGKPGQLQKNSGSEQNWLYGKDPVCGGRGLRRDWSIRLGGDVMGDLDTRESRRPISRRICRRWWPPVARRSSLKPSPAHKTPGRSSRAA